MPQPTCFAANLSYTKATKQGGAAKVFFVWVMGMSMLVNFLLLLCADQLTGHLTVFGRTVAAALFGGLYAGCCVIPGFYFLGNILWRMVHFGFISVIAYGISAGTFRRGLTFTFLSLALGGAMVGIGNGGATGAVAVAALLLILSYFGFRGQTDRVSYVPVELVFREKQVKLTALQDTGNTLRDPITGRSVLVVGADAAQKLTGLTKEQLQNPVETMGAIPGLQLIPYRSVGNRGFLLALRLQNVRIGKWQGSSLVAFAPEGLGSEGVYQALTGGNV